MKSRFIARWAAVLLTLATPALAAEPESMSRLDEALKAGTTYEYGKNPQPLRTIEQIVVAAAKSPPERATVEQRLLAALKGNATRDAKEFLCRQLFVVGTVRCVPQLEELLTDPGLAHVARLVLGRLECPEALPALGRALGKTSGKLRIGIVTTLGERRWEPAVAELAKLLNSADLGVAEAAATALGKIGGTEAAVSLEKARAKAPEPLRRHLDDALLRCADGFHAGGEDARAAEVYQRLYAPDQPKHLRIAALRGLVSLRQTESVGLLVEAIKSPDADVAASAVGFSGSVEGPAATAALASLMTDLPPQTQALLLSALGLRRDRAAVPTVLAAARAQNEAVRLAALEALGTIGDGSAADALLGVAGGSANTEAQVARASLVRLSSTEVDGVLVRALGGPEPTRRIEASRALAKRKTSAATGPLLSVAKDNDTSVRHGAIRALGELVGEEELPALVALLAQPKDAGDRQVVEGALETVFRRVSVPDRQAGPVLAALVGAPAEARPALLRLLGRAPTPSALAAVQAGLKDDQASVREAALRTLADWPQAQPAEDLLGLARSLADPTQKLIALRGYIRMAGLSKDQTAMYARAMELAQRPEDKRLVLAGLGAAGSAEALQLVEPCLAEASLESEAGLAATQIADRLRQKDAARARATLRMVLAKVKDKGVRKKALDLLNELDQFQDHILAWLGAGPFKEEGKDAEALFAVAFPPEQPSARESRWKKITQGVGPWDLNLDQAVGSGDDLVAYARTRVWSPAEQEARLELGSDDGIKAWLNGRLVHSNYTNRGLAPRQDIVKIKLQEGWNELLLKIVNRSGGWGFSCRVRQLDGSALEGLKAEAN